MRTYLHVNDYKPVRGVKAVQRQFMQLMFSIVLKNAFSSNSPDLYDYNPLELNRKMPIDMRQNQIQFMSSAIKSEQLNHW